MTKIEISIGVICYNEEKNLQKLLDSIYMQKLDDVKIKEIVVISDGSDDRTNQIIKNNDVRPIIFDDRQGKCRRLNTLLENADSKYILLCNGDVIFDEYCVERMFEDVPFAHVNIARALQTNTDNFIERISYHHWNTHHLLSKISPKATEVMAFKKKNIDIPVTLADEEYIIYRFAQGKAKYIDKALFYKTGSKTLSEYVEQIRRYQAGHLHLKKEGYTVSSFRKMPVLSSLIKALSPELSYMVFIFITILGKLLGTMDYFKGNQDVRWKIASTTKEISIS